MTLDLIALTFPIGRFWDVLKDAAVAAHPFDDVNRAELAGYAMEDIYRAEPQRFRKVKNTNRSI